MLYDIVINSEKMLTVIYFGSKLLRKQTQG